MAIDRIDWHWDEAIEAVSDNESWERAGVHIGYYIEWAFRKGWSNHEVHSAEAIQDILDSKINGVQYLKEYCDGKFWDEDLNEEGKKFTAYAYYNYVENFEQIVGHKLYTKNYNQQDFQTISKYLDQVYRNYLVNHNKVENRSYTSAGTEITKKDDFLIKGLMILDVFSIIMFFVSFAIEMAAIIAFGILALGLTSGIVLLKKQRTDYQDIKNNSKIANNYYNGFSKEKELEKKNEENNPPKIPKDDTVVYPDEMSDEDYTKFYMNKLGKVASAVKKHTARDSYRIEVVKEKTSLFDSKFGGVPYWDLSKEYPVDKNGKKLVLLAQINLEKENLESDILPQTGILQFFVENEFCCAYKEDNKVIYHETIDRSISEDDIKRLDIPTTLDPQIDITIKGEYKLALKKSRDSISVHDYRFYDVLEKVYNRLYETIDFVAAMSEWRYEGVMNDWFSDGKGHKLFGFPHFCQEDPRSAIVYNSSKSEVKLATSINDNKMMSWYPSASDMNKIKEENEKQKEFPNYNTLLLQIDSCNEFTWGDGGQINIFINSKDLKKLNFNKVLWNFDCY